jgi:hypothetical protein
MLPGLLAAGRLLPHHPKHRVGARADPAIGGDECLSEADGAPGFDECGVDLDPLSAFGDVEEVDREIGRQKAAAAVGQMQGALSASVVSRPPWTRPRELRCGSEARNPITTAWSVVRE